MGASRVCLKEGNGRRKAGKGRSIWELYKRRKENEGFSSDPPKPTYTHFYEHFLKIQT